MNHQTVPPQKLRSHTLDCSHSLFPVAKPHLKPLQMNNSSFIVKLNPCTTIIWTLLQELRHATAQTESLPWLLEKFTFTKNYSRHKNDSKLLAFYKPYCIFTRGFRSACVLLYLIRLSIKKLIKEWKCL